MTASSPPPLSADLTDGLKRLKMAAMRRLAPELLVTAKTQRWKPEEFLRTLVEAEIAARDASNARTRLRLAAFPVTKTLAEFDVKASSVPAATFDYLGSLEWIRATENLCLIGPAGTGKSHILVALGHAAVEAGHRVRYFTAAELVEALYRGLADNSVGRVIENLLRNDLVLIDLCRSRDYADYSGGGLGFGLPGLGPRRVTPWSGRHSPGRGVTLRLEHRAPGRRHSHVGFEETSGGVGSSC